jgi:hypothetical protein
MTGRALSLWHAHLVYGKNFEAVSSYFYFDKFAFAFIFSPRVPFGFPQLACFSPLKKKTGWLLLKKI